MTDHAEIGEMKTLRGLTVVAAAAVAFTTLGGNAAYAGPPGGYTAAISGNVPGSCSDMVQYSTYRTLSDRKFVELWYKNAIDSDNNLRMGLRGTNGNQFTDTTILTTQDEIYRLNQSDLYEGTRFAINARCAWDDHGVGPDDTYWSGTLFF